MAKKKGITAYGKGLVAAVGATMLAMSPAPDMPKTDQQQTQTQNSGQDKKAEALTVHVQTRDERLGFQRAFKHPGTAGRFLNQRQYRKRCRQNPSLYKSKKHRSRN